MRKAKGQLLVLEQTCLLMIGVIMLVTLILVFSTLKDDISDFTAQKQFKNIARYVHNGIIQAYVNGRFKGGYNITLSIPHQVGGHTYKIIANNTTILVKDAVSSLNNSVEIFNIGVDISGNISSTAGGQHLIIYNSTANTIQLKVE